MTRNRTRADQQYIEGFRERLAAIAKRLGSGNLLADKISRSRAGVRKWLNGEALPNALDIRALCAASGMRLQWLIDGESPESASGANYVVEQSDGRQEAFYRSKYVYEVVLALNQQVGSAMSAEQHAKMVVSLCYLFKSENKIDPEAIRMLLEASS